MVRRINPIFVLKLEIWNLLLRGAKNSSLSVPVFSFTALKRKKNENTKEKMGFCILLTMEPVFKLLDRNPTLDVSFGDWKNSQFVNEFCQNEIRRKS